MLLTICVVADWLARGYAANRSNSKFLVLLMRLAFVLVKNI